MTRKTYLVTAWPEGEKFWVVRIGGLPDGLLNTTQALREEGERDIEVMARDFIALMLEVDEDSFDLQIVIEGSGPQEFTITPEIAKQMISNEETEGESSG